MILRQVTHDDLGCASYLIGDDDAGVAAVVDPRLDIDEYLRLARYLGVSIEHVLETHTHADHVSGHSRLAAATGAHPIHPRGRRRYPHEPFDDAGTVARALVVRALHTRGTGPITPAPDATAAARAVAVRRHSRSLSTSRATWPWLASRRSGVFGSLRSLLSLPVSRVWPGHLVSLCGGPG